jgi:hypothetical protein
MGYIILENDEVSNETLVLKIRYLWKTWITIVLILMKFSNLVELVKSMFEKMSGEIIYLVFPKNFNN